MLNLTTTAYSFPDDIELFADQAGPAAAPVINDDIDETSGNNEPELDETVLGDDTAFNGVIPEDILFDSPAAELDKSNTLSSNPLGGCLSPISRIRARAGACFTVTEEPPQADEDTTVVESLRRDENIVLDQDRTVLQDVPIDQEASVVPDVLLAQIVPVNQVSPALPDMPLFPDVPVIQDRPVASDVRGVQDVPVEQNKLGISDDVVGQGAPVAQGVPVVQDVPVVQELPLELSLPLNQDLTADEAVTTNSIRQYWCSANFGLGLDKIPLCNIDDDGFDRDDSFCTFLKEMTG